MNIQKIPIAARGTQGDFFDFKKSKWNMASNFCKYLYKMTAEAS
jgi:hypothetical protein